MGKRTRPDDDDEGEESYEHGGPDEPVGLGYRKPTPAQVAKEIADWQKLKASWERDPGMWWRRPPDRRGIAAYTVMIRAPGDPERAPRPAKMADDPGHAKRWKNINKVTPDEWRRQIAKLLSDGRSRTFNEIAVTLAGTTADIAGGKNLEAGLWLAVERQEIEFTRESPVIFRAVKGARARKAAPPAPPAPVPKPRKTPRAPKPAARAPERERESNVILEGLDDDVARAVRQAMKGR